jgi:hypothetical protein
MRTKTRFAIRLNTVSAITVDIGYPDRRRRNTVKNGEALGEHRPEGEHRPDLRCRQDRHEREDEVDPSHPTEGRERDPFALPVALDEVRCRYLEPPGEGGQGREESVNVQGCVAGDEHRGDERPTGQRPDGLSGQGHPRDGLIPRRR